MISAVALYCNFARTGLFDPFFSAAMTLLFRHRRQFIGKIARIKQNLAQFSKISLTPLRSYDSCKLVSLRLHLLFYLRNVSKL